MKVSASITITLSKIMAFTILGCAMTLDILQKTNTAFLVAAPISAALILGKQYFDKSKNAATSSPDDTSGT